MIIIKSLGHSEQKWGIATSRLGHCDFAVGALRLRGWGIATRFGAFRSWGIQAVGHSGSGAFRQWGIVTIIPTTMKLN